MTQPYQPHMLKSHIPLGAPATRQPYKGDESDMRVEPGFTPSWYQQELDIDFGRAWHSDPEYRFETAKRMREMVTRRFENLSIGGQESQSGSLSGAYGSCLIPAMFGISIEYYPNNWPCPEPRFIQKNVLAGFDRLDVQNTHCFEELVLQMDLIEKKWGRIHGFLNPQGITNNALRIRGPDIMLDMYDDPPFVDHFFSVICQAMLETIKYVQSRQRASGVDVNFFTVGNCTTNMIGCELYERFVLSHDKKLCSEFPSFGLHNCNWTIDPYAESYSKIGLLGYVDMGLDSDMKRMRQLFPNTRRAVMYSPIELVNKSLDRIEQDILRIRRELSPCDIVLADIEAGTDDRRVLDFVRIAEQSLSIQVEM
ncbi:MAG: hypothetical protein ABIG61_04555 [Planctomycetota bacterium]